VRTLATGIGISPSLILLVPPVGKPTEKEDDENEDNPPD
jgi:hypothetical protein